MKKSTLLLAGAILLLSVPVGAQEPESAPPFDAIFGEEVDVRVVNVDDDHTLVTFRRPVLRGFARQLDELGARDQVAVVVQSRSQLEILSPFTTDREQTRQAASARLPVAPDMAAAAPWTAGGAP